MSKKITKKDAKTIEIEETIPVKIIKRNVQLSELIDQKKRIQAAIAATQKSIDQLNSEITEIDDFITQARALGIKEK